MHERKAMVLELFPNATNKMKLRISEAREVGLGVYAWRFPIPHKPHHTQSITETQVKMAFTVCSPAPHNYSHSAFCGDMLEPVHTVLDPELGWVHVPGVANWGFPCPPQEVSVST